MCDNGVHGDNSPEQEKQATTKRCSKCKETKALGEYYKRKASKDGVQSMCKVCVSHSNAKWLAKNPEYHAKWYAENRDNQLAYKAKYQKDNPDIVRAYKQRYRAKKRNAPGDFTASDWKAKLEYYGYRCRYCGIHKSETSEGWLEADHAIPLSRGGTNFISNIVPACKSCNCSKHAKTFTEFLDANN